MGTLWHFRERRVILARRRFVLNPFHALDTHIKTAASGIKEQFDGIDYLLDKGHSVKNAVYDQDIAKAVKNLIAKARINGFQDAAKIADVDMPALYARTVQERAAKRADWVGRKMNRTSKRELQNVPDSDFVLNEDRAMRAAEYEASRSYFRGVKDALGGNDGFGKMWVTSAAESCPECVDNEDEGLIDIDDTFQSGDDYPPAHQNCACVCEVGQMEGEE